MRKNKPLFPYTSQYLSTLTPSGVESSDYQHPALDQISAPSILDDTSEQIIWAQNEINSIYTHIMQNPLLAKDITSPYLDHYLQVLCLYADLHLTYLQQNQSLPLEKVKEIRIEAHSSYTQSRNIFALFKKPLPQNVFNNYLENKIKMAELDRETASPEISYLDLLHSPLRL